MRNEECVFEPELPPPLKMQQTEHILHEVGGVLARNGQRHHTAQQPHTRYMSYTTAWAQRQGNAMRTSSERTPSAADGVDNGWDTARGRDSSVSASEQGEEERDEDAVHAPSEHRGRSKRLPITTSANARGL